MANSDRNIINKIGQELDCGNDCYYNPKTNEIMTIPNFGQISGEDEFRDAFSLELKKVTKTKRNL